MIAPDPLDWLRQILRENVDVKSADISPGFPSWLDLVLTDGQRLAVKIVRTRNLA